MAWAWFLRRGFFDPISSADGCAPVAGGAAGFAFEEVGEVERAFEADRQGDGFQRVIGGVQEQAGFVEALLDLVLVVEQT